MQDSLLPKDTKYLGGKEALSSNIMAALSVSYVLHSSLGPNARSKLIIDSKNKVNVTNDGATIVSLLQLDHPVAKMMRDISLSQDFEIGDGTTSIIVFAGALLSHCASLVMEGVHPNVLISEIQKINNKAVSLLPELSVFFDKDELLEVLHKMASVSLSTKYVDKWNELLTKIAVDSILLVNRRRRRILVKKIEGISVEESKIEEGVVFSGKLVCGKKERLENCGILLIESICLPKPTSVKSRAIKTLVEELEHLSTISYSFYEKTCKRMKEIKVEIVLVEEQNVPRELLLLFEAYGVCVVVVKGDLKKISSLLSVPILYSLLGLDSNCCYRTPLFERYSKVCYSFDPVFHFFLMKMKKLSADNLHDLFCLKTTKQICSVILCAPTRKVLQEVERSFNDALSCLHSYLSQFGEEEIDLSKHSKVLCGAGCTEIKLISLLKEMKREFNLNVLSCYTESLKRIPFLLAQNSGADPFELISLLEKRNREENFVGVDGVLGTLMDARKVLEPLSLKSNILSSATEIVCAILRIDTVIVSKQIQHFAKPSFSK